MALFSRLDLKIWDFFNFYDEKFWLLLSIPVTIFVIACILLFVRESKRAKEEERAKKKWIKILFIIGTVVGIIELIAYIQVLIKLVLFNGFEDRFRELTIFLVVGISYGFVYFIQQRESSTITMNTALFDVTMTENGSIDIPSAVGQTDGEGSNNERVEIYVSNNTSTTISVTIGVVETLDSTLDSTDVRYGIFLNDVTQVIGNVGENSNVLYTFELAPSANITLEATMWLDYYYSGQNEVYSARYSIEAKQLDEYGRIYLTKLTDKNKGIVKVSNTEYRYNTSTPDNYVTVNGSLFRMLGVVNNNILIVNNEQYTEANATAFFAGISDKSLLDTTAGATDAVLDQYNTSWLVSVTKKAVLTLKSNVYIVGGSGTSTDPYVLSTGVSNVG